MSDYSSMATLQNNSQTAGFVTAVQRAKLVAAKLGSKRPLEDGPEPSSKKLASIDSYPPQPPQNMSYPMDSGSQNSSPSGPRMPPSGGPGGPGGPPGGGPPNLMPDQAFNEYIRVPDKMVGLIIGRGGEQITRLQAESGCKIQMAPDSGQPERLCTLTGSREAIQRAKDLVNQIVNHRGRENAPQLQDAPGGGGGGGGGGMPPMNRGGLGGGNVMDEIMLPGPKVGLIIGKNGKTIKQLQEQSGAKMVVIQDGPNTEYEKPLRISGDSSKVEHAKQLVYELLADKDMQQGGGPRPQQYDDVYSPDQGNGLATNSSEVLVPKIAVGVVIGRGGDMIKKIQAETGCRVQFHQERDDGPGDKRCYLQGKPHQVEQARQMIEDLISSVNRREQEVRGGRASGAGRGAGGPGPGPGPHRNGDRGDFQQWQDGQEVRVTFTVSNMKCGLIIGRGGEVIKQINAQSGAHCELDRRAQGADRNNRTFYIRGHPEAVEHCKRIIMEKVGMPVNFIPEGENGGNGNGGNGGGGDPYGGGGAPPAWGYNPHWHQQAAPQQPQQQVQINPSTGQPDYSQQWIEYYRSLGFIREAELIEQGQAKQQQGGGGGNVAPQGPSSGGQGVPVGPSSGGGSGGAGGAPGGGGGADYSAQWAEYYRSIGKIKEAEAIEAQIKLKQQQQPVQPAGAPTPTPQPQPGPPAGTPTPPASGPMMGYGGQYGMYGAPGVYPGYAPYPYPGGNVPPTQPEHHQ